MDGAGRLLRDALERAARTPRGRLLLVLHLSRLRSPAPRGYHRRIARAMLEDTAARHDGQVLALGNGDLAMLCRASHAPPLVPLTSAPVAERGAIAEPERLPDLLGRLFRVDMPDASRLVSLWRLDRALAAAMAYVDAPESGFSGGAGSRHDVAAEVRGELLGRTAVVDAIAELASGRNLESAMRRQTAVLLGGPRGVQPIFREVTVSIAELEARLSAREGRDESGQAMADPFLFRHLAARLDPRMLEVLRGHFGAGTPADAAGEVPIHVNLSLSGVLSEGFGRFAGACRAVMHRPRVEISLLEACVDGAAFIRARATLAQSGLGLVLDGVSHLALLRTKPAALAPDLLKLDWSPAMADLGPDDTAALAAAVGGFGAARIVLHRAETEAALRWGLAHGIRRFQGRHVDAMLGAERIQRCQLSKGCTLSQCIERGAAVASARRIGCGNPVLLDMGAVPPAPVSSATVPA